MSTKSIIVILILLVLAGGVAWAWKGADLIRLPEPVDPVATTTDPVVETITLKVFFGNRSADPEGLYCERAYPAVREVPSTDAVARTALEELLAGPTEVEKMRGFVTGINPGVKINSLVIQEGVAYADFSPELEFQVGGSCLVTAIRAQIAKTLEQFPGVDSVEISIEGRTEDILQP